MGIIESMVKHKVVIVYDDGRIELTATEHNLHNEENINDVKHALYDRYVRIIADNDVIRSIEKEFNMSISEIERKIADSECFEDVIFTNVEPKLEFKKYTWVRGEEKSLIDEIRLFLNNEC